MRPDERALDVEAEQRIELAGGRARGGEHIAEERTQHRPRIGGDAGRERSPERVRHRGGASLRSCSRPQQDVRRLVSTS